MKFLVVCILCALLGLIVAGREAPLALQFPECKTSACKKDGFSGYGCIDGKCIYVCNKNDYCIPFTATEDNLSKGPLKDLARPWGSGSKDRHNCNGGNCGFWGGCKDGFCSGFYSFKDCDKKVCEDGLFKGFACQKDGCAVICFNNICRLQSSYGKNSYGKFLDTAVPKSMIELRDLDLSNFAEIVTELGDLESPFWKFYLDHPEEMDKMKNDPTFWAQLFNDAGYMREFGPRVQMPGDACDVPQAKALAKQGKPKST